MRISPLQEQLVASGASFTERFGTQIVSSVHDHKTEYDFIRNTVGVTDFSFMQKFRVPEELGLDFLDSLVAGNVAKIRFGRLLHTLLPDSDGMIQADCYIANNDDELIVLCESIIDDSAVRSIFNNAEAGVEDLTDSHIILSVDGYKAWAVIKELFGGDILGLPYLSVEMYPFEESQIRLFRAGKTSEFGYLIMAPREVGPKLYETLLDLAKKQGGGLCGAALHNDLRLEGRFFNVFAEGVQVRDPLPLGLQWMIDFDKEQFTGRDAIVARRQQGLNKKIVGVCIAKEQQLPAGLALYDGERQVAQVQASCFSYILDAVLGLALFDIDVAYAGLTFSCGSPGGPQVTTISMPPIIPKSLTVKLDEL